MEAVTPLKSQPGAPPSLASPGLGLGGRLAYAMEFSTVGVRAWGAYVRLLGSRFFKKHVGQPMLEVGHPGPPASQLGGASPVRCCK